MGDEKCRASTDCRVNLGASPIWDTRVRGGRASAANTSFKGLEGIWGAVMKAKLGIVPAAQWNLCDSPSNRKENVNKSFLRVEYLQLQIHSLCRYQRKAQITGCQGDTGDQGCSLCWFYCKFKKMEPWHLLKGQSKCVVRGELRKKFKFSKGFPAAVFTPPQGGLYSVLTVEGISKDSKQKELSSNRHICMQAKRQRSILFLSISSLEIWMNKFDIKGAILYPFLDFHLSSQTPVEQPVERFIIQNAALC